MLIRPMERVKLPLGSVSFTRVKSLYDLPCGRQGQVKGTCLGYGYRVHVQGKGKCIRCKNFWVKGNTPLRVKSKVEGISFSLSSTSTTTTASARLPTRSFTFQSIYSI